MKSSAIASLLLLLAGTTLPAATLTVLPGEAIQPKIDDANPGDIVAIFGGTYPDDLVITKAIRLIETDGQDVTLSGNVTWNNVTNAPPFEGFTVGSPGKGIIVQDSTGLILKNIDAKAGNGIRTAGNSVVAVVGCGSSDFTQDGGKLAIRDSNVISQFRSTLNSERTVILRCKFDGGINCSSKMMWCGYSDGKRIVYSGNNGSVLIIGSTFNSGYSGSEIMTFNGVNCSAEVYNCRIVGLNYGVHWDQGSFRHYFVGPNAITVTSGNKVILSNNYIQGGNFSTNGDFGWSPSNYGCGIYSQSENCQTFNNIIDSVWRGANMPFGAISRNNFFTNIPGGALVGGVVDEGSRTGDPLFITGQAPLLQLASPCVNGGVADALFNDLDGTRNDIGPGGGCLFDPTGWTTDKPVVISFDVGPQQLLRGVDTEVRLSRGLGVGGR